MKKLTLLTLLVVLCFGLSALMTGDSAAFKAGVGSKDPTGPYNLVVQLIGDDTVLLIWENPVFNNPPMGFRIYCNELMVRYVHGSDVTDYTIEDVCEGCHDFYVAAFFDSGCESAPSNIATIMITHNEDNLKPNGGQKLVVYPNPVREDATIALLGAKEALPMQVSIYNLKGQLIRQSGYVKNSVFKWDGKDRYGRQVVEGIYLIKAITSNGSLTHKLKVVQ